MLEKIGGMVLVACMALNVACGAEKRVGIIGLDTSHSIAFTKLLNDAKKDPFFDGFRVTAAYPYGSLDIPSSTNRYPAYIKQMRDMKVNVVDSLDALFKETDVILLETNDGRRHLEQAIEVFKAGKPVFIDKPIAASLADAMAIFKASEKYGVPTFSSSALRYGKKLQEARAGKFDKIIGIDVYTPCSLEATHPGLFWYGIHGVEQLYTAMGTGCVSVVNVHVEKTDLVVGVWNDGRVTTMRGMRNKGAWYGCGIFTEKKGAGRIPLSGYEGYKPLLMEVITFFKTGKVPIPPEETLEMCAYMEAAEESRLRGGASVTIAEVMAKAREVAAKKSLE